MLDGFVTCHGVPAFAWSPYGSYNDSSRPDSDVSRVHGQRMEKGFFAEIKSRKWLAKTSVMALEVCFCVRWTVAGR